MYFLKLHHWSDDKIHARSTGPYLLVTQQPLGGKAQFGGQRFGEMEVGPSRLTAPPIRFRRILTVKSDDVVAVSRRFEAIVKGTQRSRRRAFPESIKVID